MRGRKRIYGVYSSIILLFIIFGFQLLDSSAMPQQARDGDELMNMLLMRRIGSCYYVWWDEIKKKGWKHQLHQHHYYCEKKEYLAQLFQPEE